MTKPGLRKFALTAHVTSSVGWFGAGSGALAALLGGDDQMARAASTTLELIGWFVIVPFSAASLLSGVVQIVGHVMGTVPPLLGHRQTADCGRPRGYRSIAMIKTVGSLVFALVLTKTVAALYIVTTLVAAPAQATSDDAAAIEAWLKGYDAAFVSKDLTRLAAFYHPDVTIYEGAGVNNGWADYRDRHLGPELKAFENLEFAHSETKVTVLPGGQSAYAVSRYTIKARMGDRLLDNEGLETLVLLKTADGWRIRHSHTSGRARRPAP